MIEGLTVQELINLVYEMNERLVALENKYGKLEYRVARASLPSHESNWSDWEDKTSPYDLSQHIDMLDDSVIGSKNRSFRRGRRK